MWARVSSWGRRRVSGGGNQVPDGYALYQSFPNPFNSSTRIGFDLPRAGRVEIAVYNLLGQEVRLLVSGIQPGGHNSITWDGRDGSGRSVPSGPYLYIMKTVDSQMGRTATVLQ
mgnify:CR=1 FL=1